MLFLVFDLCLAVKKKKSTSLESSSLLNVVVFSGHFLFLQVKESNSLQEASIKSSSFPRPISTTACQVSSFQNQSFI